MYSMPVIQLLMRVDHPQLLSQLKLKKIKLRDLKGELWVWVDSLSDFPHENSVLCVLSPNPP